MKRLVLAAVAAVSTLATPTQAQGVQGLGILALDPVDDGNTVLTINGTSVVMRQADVADFNAGVTTVGATAEEALRENAAKMTRVLAAAKRLGIADKDIQTSSVAVVPVMSNERDHPMRFRSIRGGSAAEAAAAAAEGAAEAAAAAAFVEEPGNEEPRIVGYRASNQVAIRQRKLDQFGRTIDALVAAGANEVEGPDFRLENSTSSEEEARLLAIADARKRAETYAAAAGLRVVRIIMIDEGRTSGLSSRSPSNGFAFMEAMEGGRYYPTPVASGELTIVGSVGVMFELAPN